MREPNYIQKVPGQELGALMLKMSNILFHNNQSIYIYLLKNSQINIMKILK